VTDGELISSVRYKSRSEGIAKNIKITAGRTVQIVSICCASDLTREVYFLIINVSMAYVTTETIIARITNEWSWKEII